ncbi:MAG: hypothetical protein IJT98_05240, partial [Prevotella sp.]|nr:hypothetical protein [Prevotella sp.]
MKQTDDTLRSQTLMLTMKALNIISKALDILSAGKPPDTVLYCVRRFCRRNPLAPLAHSMAATAGMPRVWSSPTGRQRCRETSLLHQFLYDAEVTTQLFGNISGRHTSIQQHTYRGLKHGFLLV